MCVGGGGKGEELLTYVRMRQAVPESLFALRSPRHLPPPPQSCLQDPAVMSSALSALHEVIKTDPRPYKNLVPSFTSILKQVQGGGR